MWERAEETQSCHSASSVRAPLDVGAFELSLEELRVGLDSREIVQGQLGLIVLGLGDPV